MRIKSRFIIAQILPAGATTTVEIRKLQLRDIHQTLRDKIQELYGDIGSGEIGGSTMAKFFDAQHTGLLVVRCPREHEASIHFALSTLTKIKTVDIAIRTLRVKGSSRTCIDMVQELATLFISGTVKDLDEQAQIVDALNQTISSMDL